MYIYISPSSGKEDDDDDDISFQKSISLKVNVRVSDIGLVSSSSQPFSCTFSLLTSVLLPLPRRLPRGSPCYVQLSVMS